MVTTTANQVVINPPVKATGCVIWLHGLGADGHDFVDIVPLLNCADKTTRFLFPHAPIRPVTINGSIPMRAWFDLKGGSLDERAPDRAGIMASREGINELIAAQVADGIETEQIVLVGFSQGGAVALDCGLRYPYKLAGILGLSTCLPLADDLAHEGSAANKTTPIALMHGTEDEVLPIQLGKRSRDFLRSIGYRVAWHEYPMAHNLCPQQITDISDWLNNQLSSAAS